MGYRVIALALAVAACHQAPAAERVEGVTIRGVTTDDITVTVSAQCWTTKPDNYCESIARRLQRDQTEDKSTKDIIARELRAVEIEKAARQ